MIKNHSWIIGRENYKLIEKGIKTFDVRVGYSDIKLAKNGDTVTYRGHTNEKYEIIRVTYYQDLIEMLDTEKECQKIVPGVSKYKALEILQAIYPEEKEKLGIYLFELKKIEINNLRAFCLSSLKENRKTFSKLIQTAYAVTDEICDSYPDYFNWYWTKQIPRVINGTGEIVICASENIIIGIALLKKDDKERKICTFYIVEKYRRNKISELIISEVFKYLETSKPLITFPDNEYNQFINLVRKYDWEITKEGTEYVCNSK